MAECSCQLLVGSSEIQHLPTNMLRSDFHYDLPPELIAQEPRVRGASRMMVVRPHGGPVIEHGSFAEFPSMLSPRDVLVLNDTRVFPARLFASPHGNMRRGFEFLLTSELAPLSWEAWCKPARRVRTGSIVTFSDRLTAQVTDKREDGSVVLRFEVASEETFWREIDAIGAMPTPPYIRRNGADPRDRESYQTVYASRRGAIAAPTAGLHFTPGMLEEIAARGVEIVRVTLHVGIGTFEPVKVERIEEHRMHSERYEISPDAAAALNAALEDKRRIVAVGTTSVRTLESAIAAGDGTFRAGDAETSIFITPGFRFRATGAMLTNFHLPESTLLMLVSAFAGVETIRTAYRTAVEERYMFFSYGDCMFLANEA